MTYVLVRLKPGGKRIPLKLGPRHDMQYFQPAKPGIYVVSFNWSSAATMWHKLARFNGSKWFSFDGVPFGSIPRASTGELTFRGLMKRADKAVRRGEKFTLAEIDHLWILRLDKDWS